MYVQINSEKAPDGNLTGWLLPPHPFPGEGVPVAGQGSFHNSKSRNEKAASGILRPCRRAVGRQRHRLGAGSFHHRPIRRRPRALCRQLRACHGATLAGAGEAPPLAGSTFLAAWGNRTTEEFYNLVKASMPYGNGNSLDADTYRRIVAYVLGL
jgi:hypothetical protein